MTKRLMACLVVAAMTLNLVACGGEQPAALGSDRPSQSTTRTSTQLSRQISEAAPPETIQQLRQFLEPYQPQVRILSPKPNQVVQDNEVAVQFDVKDLPIFKDPALGLGPHLHAILDNQPYQAVYDPGQPLILKDLTPGTHTLRVFASRPWHESFKNEGAYAQLTFHVFTKTEENNPDSRLPLVSYSRPTGAYGAEPIMLDFYLTNAPLHLVAQEDAEDEISDWRIRCTINGESFVIDRWQPIYLKGFKPGKNWVQIEFLDEKGNPVKNAYNNTVRLVTYEPGGTDTLSKLIRQELSVAEARGIVDPNYKPPVPEPSPTPVVEPAPEPTPVPESTPIPEPTVLEPPTLEAPVIAPAEPEPAPIEIPAEPTPVAPAIEPAPTPEKPGFFQRFGWPKSAPAPAPVPTPEAIPAPELVPVPAPTVVEPPTVEPPAELPAEPELAPIEIPAEPTPVAPAVEPAPASTKPGFFQRFGWSKSAPVPTPEAAPMVEPTLGEPETTEIPVEDLTEPAEPVPAPEPSPVKVPAPAKPGFFNRFDRVKPTATPVPTPATEVVPAPEPVNDGPDAVETPTESPGEAPEVVPVTPPSETPVPSKPSFLERFGKLKPTPTPAPIPSPEPAPAESAIEPEPTPEPVEIPDPTPDSTPVVPSPAVPALPKPSFLNRFGRTPVQPVPATPVVPDRVSPEPTITAPAPEPVETPVETPAPLPEILVPTTPAPAPKATSPSDLRTRFLQRTAAQPERQPQPIPDILGEPESPAPEIEPEAVPAE